MQEVFVGVYGRPVLYASCIFIMFDIPMTTAPVLGLDSLGSSVPGNPGQGVPPQGAPVPGQGVPPFQAQPPQQTPPPQQAPAQNFGQQPQPRSMPAGNGVVLKKGQKTSLTAINPNLRSIRVGLGWDVGMNTGYDLDSEVFMLGANEKVIGDNWFVFYGQLVSPDGSVVHRGDNRTGDGEGDDEIIDIDLSRISPQVAKLVFVVTINEAREHGYNFGQVSNAYIRIIDNSNGAELVRFSLSEYYKEVVSMVVGEVYLRNGEWRFNPVGMGTGEDLEQLCIKYGVNVAG